MLLEPSMKNASRCTLKNWTSLPPTIVFAPIISRSVGVVFFPPNSNSIAGEGTSTRNFSSSGVLEKIASPMPKGSSRGSALG